MFFISHHQLNIHGTMARRHTQSIKKKSNKNKPENSTELAAGISRITDPSNDSENAPELTVTAASNSIGHGKNQRQPPLNIISEIPAFDQIEPFKTLHQACINQLLNFLPKISDQYTGSVVHRCVSFKYLPGQQHAISLAWQLHKQIVVKYRLFLFLGKIYY